MKPTTFRSENDYQEKVALFLRLAIRRPDRWWFCPNGGNLSIAQAGRFKAMGLQPGVSDLHFAWAMGAQRQFPCYGVIELKHGKNTETADQIAFGKDMAALGHSYACHWSQEGVEAIERTLRGWEVPLHATILGSGVIRTAVRA